MDVQLDRDLNALLSKDCISDKDAFIFLRNLSHLSKELMLNRYETYGPIVKRWIRAYETIFCEGTADATALSFISKSFKTLTSIFLNFMHAFNKHDPAYNQEFYYYWKLIISGISGARRAKNFCRFIQQFKIMVENLRTATHRLQQIAILSVLILYVENTSTGELNELKERYNAFIVSKLAVLKEQPTTVKRHEFLHEIHPMGRCIISLQPTKIVCHQMFSSFTDSSSVLWIDFNLNENSITLIALSPTEDTINCIATVTKPKLKEKVDKEQELQIRGTWSIIMKGSEAIQKKIIIKVYIPIHDRNALWKAQVKSIFCFVSGSSIFSQSMSQVCPSDSIDHRLTKFAADDGRYVALPIQYESETSFSTSLFQNDSSINRLGTKKNIITPIAQKQLEDDDEMKGNTNERVPPTAVDKSISGIEKPTAVPIEPERPFDEHDECSSGVSFGANISVSNYDASENEISEHGSQPQNVFQQSKQEIDEIQDSERIETEANLNTPGNFSPIYSFSINDHVKKFIEGTGSTQPPRDNLVASQTSRKRDDQTEEIKTYQLNDSIRSIIGMHVAASDEFSQEQIMNPMTGVIAEPEAEPQLSQSKSFSTVQVAIGNKNQLVPALSPEGSSESLTKHTPLMGLSSPNRMSENTGNVDVLVGSNISAISNLQPQSNRPIACELRDDNNITEFVNDEKWNPKDTSAVEKSNEVDVEERENTERQQLLSQRCESPRRSFSVSEDGAKLSNESIGRGAAKRKVHDSSGEVKKRRTVEQEINEPVRSQDDSSVLPTVTYRFPRGKSKKRSKKSPFDKLKKSSDKKPPRNTVLINSENDETATNYNLNVESHEENSAMEIDDELQRMNESYMEVECNPVDKYLTDFVEERETCGKHQQLLLELIKDLQNTIRPDGNNPLDHGVLLLATASNIRNICEQARQAASKILQSAKEL